MQMYDTHIQTTIAIRGHVIFIEYFVTKDWAVEWWLNYGAYDLEDSATNAAFNLLDTMLRTHEHARINGILMDEFEARQYEQEQRVSALADMENNRIF
jgi:hypothetical protein